MAKYTTTFNKAAILLVLVAGIRFEILRVDCLNCTSWQPNTTESRIREIYYSYDTINRPIRLYANASINVRLRLVLRKIHFDEQKDTLEIHSWFVMYWTDCRYGWNPSMFGNITEIHLPSYYFWKPDIADFTGNDMAKTLPLIRSVICILYSDGTIMCVPPYNHVVACSANLRSWPYDTHTCTMKIGSWTYKGDEINITILKRGIFLNGYSSNREWKLVSTTSYNQPCKNDSCLNDTFRWVAFEFVLQRHPGSYSSTVVMPAVVLMIMTLITFCMEPTEADRLVLATVNLVSHILFLQHLGKILPANGDQTPLIITFYRDSMFLAAMAFFTSVVAPDLKASTMDLPLWASFISNLVLQSRFGQVFFVQGLDKTNACVVSETFGGEDHTVYPRPRPRPSWTVFRSLIDFTCFVITLLSYTVLLLGYIP